MDYKNTICILHSMIWVWNKCKCFGCRLWSLFFFGALLMMISLWSSLRQAFIFLCLFRFFCIFRMLESYILVFFFFSCKTLTFTLAKAQLHQDCRPGMSVQIVKKNATQIAQGVIPATYPNSFNDFLPW